MPEENPTPPAGECAAPLPPSIWPSLSTSPPQSNRSLQTSDRPLRKYTPYKFDAPPLCETPPLDLIDSMAAAATPSDSRGAGPLLLAALESIGEVGNGPSEPSGSSQRPSLSPNQNSNTSSDRTSDTSVAHSRDTDSGSVATLNNLSHSSAYSHPAYSALQHPLYSRPLAPNSAYPSSTYSLPPINRSSYTPYNYQSSYSRPLSSSGPVPVQGNPHANAGPTTLPPLNLAVLSANSDFRAPPNLSSPIGATNPSSYAQNLSLNPYNHPAYASAASHTFQHPAYARSSISASSGPPGFAPPPPVPQGSTQLANGGATNPYSHPAPPGASASLSPWSGPPPPSLSMNAGSLLAKRRRSDTTVPTAFGTNSGTGRNRAEPDQFDEEDELAESDEDEREDVEPLTTTSRNRLGTSQKRLDRDGEADLASADREDLSELQGDPGEDGDGAEDEDEGELAPQVKASRPTKRARTASARSDETSNKPETQIRPRLDGSESRSPVIKSKGVSKPKNKPERSKDLPEKKFICPHPSCGRAFARHFNLNSHIKSHQGIREFKCPECSKLFSRKHDCTRHCVAIHGYDKGSGKGVIHEPSQQPGPSSGTASANAAVSPAPHSPPPSTSTSSRPLPPAAHLLHASGSTSTSASSARQSLAMLLQQPSDSTSDPNESPASSTSTTTGPA